MIEDIRAVQTIRWVVDDKADGGGFYEPSQWAIQYRKGINHPWEEIKLLTTYVGGPYSGKSTVNRKDIEE